jgi:hypothetical protein
MKLIVEYPEEFISNVLDPLVEQLKDHSAVYGIDIMNEPEACLNLTRLFPDLQCTISSGPVV